MSEVVRVSVVVEMPGLPGRVGGVAQSSAEQADLLVVYEASAVRHACDKHASLFQHFLMFVPSLSWQIFCFFVSNGFQKGRCFRTTEHRVVRAVVEHDEELHPARRTRASF